VASPINIRAMRPSDENFIRDGWVQSYSKSPHVCEVPRQVYFDAQRKVIARLLAKSTTYVAHWPEDDDALYGFVCGVPDRPKTTLHYVYVKQVFRREGIAKELIGALVPPGAEVVCSHRPWGEWKREQATKRGYVYSPYAAHEVAV